MIETIKTSLVLMMMTAWSTVAMAQTAPGGTAAPGSAGGGTSAPVGAGTGAGAVGDGGETSWLWIVIAAVVIAGLLFYFLGRNRGTRV